MGSSKASSRSPFPAVTRVGGTSSSSVFISRSLLQWPSRGQAARSGPPAWARSFSQAVTTLECSASMR